MATPSEWRRKAAEYARKRDEATERGDAKEALVMDVAHDTALRVAELYEEAAAKAKALPLAKRSSKLNEMTPGQIERRARAIAGAAAKRTNDRFLLAIKGSRWRSMTKYARERLDISPAMLTFYRQGRYQVPPGIAKQVHEDLGLPPDKRTWPAGVAT